MDNARRSRAVDWAAYFAEYGFFSTERPERAEGPPLLTGANVAYKRHVIADVIGWAQDGEWENVAHTATRRARQHASLRAYRRDLPEPDLQRLGVLRGSIRARTRLREETAR